jgi:hypothetical protein
MNSVGNPKLSSWRSERQLVFGGKNDVFFSPVRFCDVRGYTVCTYVVVVVVVVVVAPKNNISKKMPLMFLVS